jgi:hypothetical protein
VNLSKVSYDYLAVSEVFSATERTNVTVRTGSVRVTESARMIECRTLAAEPAPAYLETVYCVNTPDSIYFQFGPGGSVTRYLRDADGFEAEDAAAVHAQVAAPDPILLALSTQTWKANATCRWMEPEAIVTTESDFVDEKTRFATTVSYLDGRQSITSETGTAPDGGVFYQLNVTYDEQIPGMPRKVVQEYYSEEVDGQSFIRGRVTFHIRNPRVEVPLVPTSTPSADSTGVAYDFLAVRQQDGGTWTSLFTDTGDGKPTPGKLRDIRPTGESK